jgi:hypothetical protein
VFQIGFNGRDDDSRFNGEQVNTNERNTDPRINDDALIQYVVKNVNDTRVAWRMFESHPTALSFRAMAFPALTICGDGKTVKRNAGVFRGTGCAAAIPRSRWMRRLTISFRGVE